jgi:hypothetical protein
MPRVSDRFLASVVFLYKSKDAAEKGFGSGGGSGFIIGVAYEAPADRYHYYLVTNKHVISRGGLWVRINVGDLTFARMAVHETTPAMWDPFHPDSDLAVCQFNPPEEWNFACITSTTLITADQIKDWGIGVGDEVFVPARLLGFEGELMNTPVLHTGAVSMMAGDPIKNQDTSQLERGYLVEVHSRGGFSGSPVIGMISPKQVQFGGPPRGELGEIGYLLGVVWSNLSEKYPVLSKDGNQTGEYVWIPRGLTGVVPASAIADMLNQTKFRQQRETDEGKWMETHPEPETRVEPLHGEVETSLGATAGLMGKLLAVPKDEADEVHRGHQE